MKKFKKIALSIKFIGGLVLILAGIAVMLLGNWMSNPIVIVLGLSMAGGGGYLIKTSWSYSEKRDAENTGHLANLKDNPPNAVVIRKNSIEFTTIAEPDGQSRKCYNDGLFYHVLIEDDKSMREFALPDAEEEELHYDPTEFGNVVTMPLNRRYFAFKDDLFQKVSLAIMGIVVGAELIALIVFAG